MAGSRASSAFALMLAVLLVAGSAKSCTSAPDINCLSVARDLLPCSPAILEAELSQNLRTICCRNLINLLSRTKGLEGRVETCSYIKNYFAAVKMPLQDFQFDLTALCNISGGVTINPSTNCAQLAATAAI